MEDYGLPTWGSYLIFALATIVLGALLGLVSFIDFPNYLLYLILDFQILVCVIDFIYPPRQSSTSKPTNAEKREDKHSGDELVSILFYFL